MIDPAAVKVLGSKQLAPGVRAILGKRPGSESSEVQAYRFAADKFTATQAKAWLKDNDKEPVLFEEATGEDRADAETWESRCDDAGELLPAKDLPDGTMLVEGFLARPGILVYRRDGKTIRELVPESTLMDPDYLLGIGFNPVTLEHPTNALGIRLVTPETYQADAAGTATGDIEVLTDGWVKVRLHATRADAVSAIRTGTKRGLSPGYMAIVEPTPGTDPTFGRYDAVQVRRRANHIALCANPRGGSGIGIRADAMESPMLTDELRAKLLARPDLAALRTDATPDEEFLHAALARLLAAAEEREAMSMQMDGLKSDLQAKSAAYDAECAAHTDTKTLFAAEKQAHADTKAAMAGMVPKADAMALPARVAWSKERAVLADLAKTHGVTVANFDSLDNSALRRELVKAICPQVRADAADDYIRGVLDTLPAVDPMAQYARLSEQLRSDSHAGGGRGIEPAWVRQAREAHDANATPSPKE